MVGNNGSGKSTLLRIMEGSLKPSSGEVVCSSKPYYVPQHFGQYDELTVVQALQVEAKIKALHAIIAVSYTHLDVYKRQRLYFVELTF